MKKILITGAGKRGFVGKNLKEALCDEYELFTPPHSELELLDYNALESYVKQNKIEIIIHSAIHVPSVNGASNEFYNDMTMFMNMEKISRNIEKLIYFGSGAEFDKRYDIRGVEEDSLGKTIPTSEYGLAKYVMNTIARRSDNIYNLRLFGIFGKYEDWRVKYLSNICCKTIYGFPLTIRRDCLFDFIYIDDLVYAVRSVIEKDPKYHDYNVCSGKEYSLSFLANEVLRVSGKDVPIVMLSDERNLDYTASNKRLLNEMPSFHVTPINEALTKLYAYYCEHKDEVDPEILKNTR
ncbi:MAG: NAD(P)-dependent oxidoreductase [Clostridiales bacterium]|nr:NAD(P)-dependent oxidoreductase [Clostridiales bacterium]